MPSHPARRRALPTLAGLLLAGALVAPLHAQTPPSIADDITLWDATAWAETQVQEEATLADSQAQAVAGEGDVLAALGALKQAEDGLIDYDAPEQAAQIDAAEAALLGTPFDPAVIFQALASHPGASVVVPGSAGGPAPLGTGPTPTARGGTGAAAPLSSQPGAGPSGPTSPTPLGVSLGQDLLGDVFAVYDDLADTFEDLTGKPLPLVFQPGWKVEYAPGTVSNDYDAPAVHVYGEAKLFGAPTALRTTFFPYQSGGLNPLDPFSNLQNTTYVTLKQPLSLNTLLSDGSGQPLLPSNPFTEFGLQDLTLVLSTVNTKFDTVLRDLGHIRSYEPGVNLYGKLSAQAFADALAGHPDFAELGDLLGTYLPIDDLRFWYTLAKGDTSQGELPVKFVAQFDLVHPALSIPPEFLGAWDPSDFSLSWQRTTLKVELSKPSEPRIELRLLCDGVLAGQTVPFLGGMALTGGQAVTLSRYFAMDDWTGASSTLAGTSQEIDSNYEWEPFAGVPGLDELDFRVTRLAHDMGLTYQPPYLSHVGLIGKGALGGGDNEVRWDVAWLVNTAAPQETVFHIDIPQIDLPTLLGAFTAQSVSIPGELLPYLDVVGLEGLRVTWIPQVTTIAGIDYPRPGQGEGLNGAAAVRLGPTNDPWTGEAQFILSYYHGLDVLMRLDPLSVDLPGGGVFALTGTGLGSTAGGPVMHLRLSPSLLADPTLGAQPCDNINHLDLVQGLTLDGRVELFGTSADLSLVASADGLQASTDAVLFDLFSAELDLVMDNPLVVALPQGSVHVRMTNGIAPHLELAIQQACAGIPALQPLAAGLPVGLVDVREVVFDASLDAAALGQSQVTARVTWALDGVELTQTVQLDLADLSGAASQIAAQLEGYVDDVLTLATAVGGELTAEVQQGLDNALAAAEGGALALVGTAQVLGQLGADWFAGLAAVGGGTVGGVVQTVIDFFCSLFCSHTTPTPPEPEYPPNHEYYSTLRFIVAGGDPLLLVRRPDGLYTARWTGGGFAPVAGPPLPLTDAGGWNLHGYYSTLDVEQHAGTAVLVIRGAASLKTWRWNTVTKAWDAIAHPSLMSDGANWDEPEHYATIQLVDAGGELLLLGRGGDGLATWRFTGSGWQFEPNGWITGMSNANQWTAPQYYSTIQAVSHAGTAALIGRGSGGIFSYEWNHATRSWVGTANYAGAFIPISDTAGWDQEHFYGTIRLVSHDDRLLVIARSFGGIKLWRYDDGLDRWIDMLPQTPVGPQGVPVPLMPSPSWDPEMYWSTMDVVQAGADLVLFGRAAQGIVSAVLDPVTLQFSYYEPGVSGTIYYPPLSNALGWGGWQYYDSIAAFPFGPSALLIGVDAANFPQMWLWDSQGDRWQDPADFALDLWAPIPDVTSRGVAVGAQGHLWRLTSTAVAGGFTVQELRDGVWENRPGLGAERLSVSPLGDAVAVTSLGQAWRWSRSAAAWQALPGSDVVDADVADDGTVWLLTNPNPFVVALHAVSGGQLSDVQLWYVSSDPSADRVSVDGSGSLYVLANEGSLRTARKVFLATGDLGPPLNPVGTGGLLDVIDLDHGPGGTFGILARTGAGPEGTAMSLDELGQWVESAGTGTTCLSIGPGGVTYTVGTDDKLLVGVL